MTTALLEEFGSADARERAESWRYSRNALNALAQTDFAAADARATLPTALVARFDWAETRGRRIVFVNGAYSPAYSDLQDDAAFALGNDGAATITLEHDDAAVHVVHASVAGAHPARWAAGLDVRVRARRARLVEQHVGTAGKDVLGVLRARIELAANAGLLAATLTDLPDSASLFRRREVSVAADAAHADVDALFGGRLQRHETSVRLRGVRAHHVGRGVFVVRGRQHIDAHLDVRHAARDAASDVVWRGVADQRARGILHGAITVAAGADGADARLQTKNLLLSPFAEIDAQPVLEIHADEVKASHGATVGQLDERALFYLRSRGVPAAAARRLLIAGFCREILADIDAADLRARIESPLDERLPLAEPERS